MPEQNRHIFKRITVEVDGYKVDALIIGKKATIQNRKWVLVSNGSNEFYEKIPAHSTPKKGIGSFKEDSDIVKIADNLESNLLIFNYPGVQSSSGLPSRKAVSKAYRAMLNFLEDKKGIGANEIVGYGLCLGGAAQAEALEVHRLKSGIKYIFIKDRTFSNITSLIFYGSFSSKSYLLLAIIIAKVFGWNMNCANSSRRLSVPEIIIQHSDEDSPIDEGSVIKDCARIRGDGLIEKKSSLAKYLLEHQQKLTGSKAFLGTTADHTYEHYRLSEYFIENLSLGIQTQMTD